MYNKKSVVDIAYDYCIDKIKSGEWKANHKIPSETEFVEILQISKVSIRAAMQRLRAKGIIVTNQGKGSYISKNLDGNSFEEKINIINLSDKDLIDISEFREAVEIKAIELAIERCDKSDIFDIENAYEEMRISTDDYRKYTKADLKFHLAVIKASKNQVLYESVLSIQDRYYMYFEELNRNFLKGADLKVSLKGHENILCALKLKDKKLAIEDVLHGIEMNKEKISFRYKVLDYE